MTEQPGENKNKKSDTHQGVHGTQLNDQILILSGPVGIFKLNKSRVVIGSVVSADVRLDGEAIAPIHAVIEMPSESSSGEEGTLSEVMIYDLASETGIFVNGRKVITGSIKSGDKLAIGSYLLTVSLNELNEVKKETSKDEVFYTGGLISEGGGRPLFLTPGEDVSSLLLGDESEAEPIFDYRPAQKLALEVVMSWRGTILNVEHFVKKGTVTIGESRRNDFGIPALLQTKNGVFTFIRRRNQNYTLYLDPKMKGVVQRRGKLERLEQFRNEVPLDQDVFAKISVNEVDFYVSFTAAPPRLKTTRIWEKDPFFIRIFWMSILLSAVMMRILWTSRVPQLIEAEQIPERIATILYNPEKYIPKHVEEPRRVPVVKPTTSPVEPAPTKTVETVKVEVQPKPQETPKEIPREMNMKPKQAVPQKPQNQKNSSGASTPAKKVGPRASQSQNEAREGAGARAKGKEGIRGQPHAPRDSIHQDKATRPSPQGGQGSGVGNSQVQDIGNVDLLNTATAKITDILGNGADRLGKGGEKLKGFGTFTTQGTAGLALSGTGQGGGGTADTTLGGLSDHGTGGGRVGTGKGAAGNGNGIVGGKVRVAIRTGGAEEAYVMGSIDKDAIAAAMQAHYDEFRLCYEKEVNAESPNLAGRVGTTFVIGSTGRVTQAGIESTSLKNANTERCILDVIRRIDFPIPKGAGIVQVSYPFKFNRSNSR